MAQLTQLYPAYPKTAKGTRTWEWHTPDGRQITVCHRLSGEWSGPHFHKGNDPSKNPEIFLLIKGKMKIELIDKTGYYQQIEISAENDPTQFIIQPYVLHKAQMITDCYFIEYRTTLFNPNDTDTFEVSEFPIKTDW